MLEVGPLTTANKGFRRGPVEAEVPDRRIVVDRLPAFDAGQKRVHEHQPVDVVWELRGVRVGDHQSDVVSDDGRLVHTEAFHERMQAGGGVCHVQAIGWNGGSTDPGQIGCNHRVRRRQARYQWPPHARRFGVAVQEYDGWTAARGQILQRRSIHGCRADGDRRTRFGSPLRAGRDGLCHECQNERDCADQVPPCHETLLSVNAAIPPDAIAVFPVAPGSFT